jgi:voltage-gated potassium channel
MNSPTLTEAENRITAVVALRSFSRVTAILTLLFLTYAAVPGVGASSWVKILVFALALVALVFLVVFQIRSILSATHPGLRAAEVLADLLGLVLVIFSLVYLSMSQTNSQMFSAPLDHITALYFTVVVFSTVGFGDIVAKTDSARLIVTIQILLDIVFIGVVVRLALGAVQRKTGGTG